MQVGTSLKLAHAVEVATLTIEIVKSTDSVRSPVRVTTQGRINADWMHIMLRAKSANVGALHAHIQGHGRRK